jgi:hypothetical protein
MHKQALATPPSQLGLTDTGTPGLQLAVACAASVYFLRQNKRLGLGESGRPLALPISAGRAPVPCSDAAAAGPATAVGQQRGSYCNQMTCTALLKRAAVSLTAGRAAALTGGGFVLGTILGAVIQNWLRVDIVPLGVSPAAHLRISQV